MEKVLHVYDYDDVFVETPTFAEFVQAGDRDIVDTTKIFVEYFDKLKSAFKDVLSKDVVFIRMRDFVVPIDNETKNPFPAYNIEQFADKKYRRMFQVKDEIMVLNPFPGFHSDPATLGSILNEPIFQSYKEASNRMILTGRGKDLKEKIEYTLSLLGVDYPNYGLHTFTNGSIGISQFKTNTILQSIKDNDWNVVHFYEDHLDWLSSAREAVLNTFPNVQFVAHPITNIKEKRRL